MTSRNRVKSWLAGTMLACGLVGASHATVVSGFDMGFTAAGQWYKSDVTAGGTASVVGGAPAGGPLPGGAALLTTDFTNPAKAVVSVSDNYGTAGNVLSTLTLHYSYYKQLVAGGNAAAAPAIKLSFLNVGFAGDNDLTLIYEPYQNMVGNPTTNAWHDVDISFTSGLFWANGGLGSINGAGGGTMNTLQGWLTALGSGLGNATLHSLSIGVGSYNQGQIGYFDDVRMSIGATQFAAVYDFEARAVPEPDMLVLFGAGLLALVAVRRRATSKA